MDEANKYVGVTGICTGKAFSKKGHLTWRQKLESGRLEGVKRRKEGKKLMNKVGLGCGLDGVKLKSNSNLEVERERERGVH